MKSSKKEFEKLYDLLLKEKPRKADAIVWLQGDRFDRSTKVMKLYQEGWSKRIFISGNNVLVGKKMRLGENNISLKRMMDYLLRQGVNSKDLIVDSASKNTKEQAEHVFKIVNDHKWTSLILVGTSYYQPRAFLTFLKQAEKIGWNGRIINQPLALSWDEKPSGRSKTTQLLFKDEFEKMRRYNMDLVSIKRGIKYLC